MSITKTCTRCDREQYITDFYMHKGYKDGYTTSCKTCTREYSKEYAIKNKAKIQQYKKEHRELPRVKQLERSAYKRRIGDPKYREKLSSYLKEYRNRTEIKERDYLYQKKYREVNKGHAAKHCAKRRAKKLQATPKWYTELDDFIMAEAYEIAKLREESTGIKWHVDHIIPLQGVEVCGLHVGNNIQVLPAIENCSKRNRIRSM